MRRSIRAVIVAAALAVLSWDPAFAATVERQAAPQAPARDTAPPRTGTGRIRGRVIAADSGRPLRRVVVRVSSPDLRDSRAKVTDAEGKYEFPSLPAGSYSIYASKSGFIGTQLGAARPGDFGKSVKVADGEIATAGDIALMRASTISGRVIDEFGEPVENTSVLLLRYRSLGGARRLMSTTGRSTDDLGQFRMSGLEPGTYYLCVRGSSMSSDIETDDRSGYAPTFYPGTPNASDAQPIQVTAGQDVPGLEIMLCQVRVARVSGIALDASGRPPVNASLGLTPLDGGLAFGGSLVYGRVMPDGTFTVNNVPPGDYMLELRSSPPPTPGSTTAPRMQYGRARVSVAGSDVTGIAVQTTTGASLSGQVVFEGGVSAPAGAKMSVIATAPPPLGSPSFAVPGVAPAQVAADGSFMLVGLYGDYYLRFSGAPNGWTLKAVYVNGRDVTDTPMTLDGRDRVTGAQIILTDRITHVTGTVNDETGQPAETAYVIVVPGDPDKLVYGPGSRYQRSTLVRSGNPLKIDGLPAGDYLAIAWKSIPPEFDPYTAEFFDYARKTGTRFSLREAETRTLTLRLVEAPAK